jgi:hypothetical protein
MTIEITLEPDTARYTVYVDGKVLTSGMRLADAYRAAWSLARTATDAVAIYLPPMTATYPTLYVD